MSSTSKIEWTDATWNPIRGCKKISPGCKHCYAETFAERFRGVPDHPYQYGFDLRLVPHKLSEPLHWTSPKTVFVNSMSDLFQEDVPTDYIIKVAQIMAATEWHTYQVLTKRSVRMKNLLRNELRFAAALPHIWWGVSVENKRHGVPRIKHLKESPAQVRFLSVEPLLEDIGQIDLEGIHWVIVGGESGPGFRKMKSEWVDSILRQCEHSDTPFFFKQWGGFPKSKNGRDLNDRTYDSMPLREFKPIPPRNERLKIMNSLLLDEEGWRKRFTSITL